MAIANGKTIVQNLHTVCVSELRRYSEEVMIERFQVTRAAIIVQSSHQKEAFDSLRENRRRTTAMVAMTSNVAVIPYNGAVRL